MLPVIFPNNNDMVLMMLTDAPALAETAPVKLLLLPRITPFSELKSDVPATVNPPVWVIEPAPAVAMRLPPTDSAGKAMAALS